MTLLGATPDSAQDDPGLARGGSVGGGGWRALRNAARVLVGMALGVLAVTRAAMAVGWGVPEAAGAAADVSQVRRLASAADTAAQAACPAESLGLPVMGVRYVPHLVGEPYPHPESPPVGYYSSTYSGMHQRDLPIIGGHVGADTLSLRPWSTDGTEHERTAFFDEMRKSGICKVIPSFQASKYYADMLRMHEEQPRTDPSSAFAVAFQRFGATVGEEALGGIQLAAWTLDLSLDLESLLPLVAVDCEFSKVPEDKAFRRYLLLVSAIQRWVHSPGASVAPALAEAPFLLPLDISRVPWTEPSFQKQLNTFVKCMSRSQASGGWSPFFDELSSASFANRTRWLFSFAEPTDEADRLSFRQQLENVSAALLSQEVRAVVMVGAQALRRGGSNPVNSVNLEEDFGVDGSRYTRAYADYRAVSNATQVLDGLIYDEWMDDWDRGARGPFFLAADDILSMQDRCESGSRFAHDIDACSKQVGFSGIAYPEYFGLAASSSQVWRHCVHLRMNVSLFGSAGDYTPKACAMMTPDSTTMTAALSMFAIVLVVQLTRLAAKWCSWDRHERQVAGGSVEKAVAKAQAEAQGEVRVGYIAITPRGQPLLAGGHQIELRSRRLRSGEEAGWWLWTHVHAQLAILERQVTVELGATVALKERRAYRASLDASREGQASMSPTGSGKSGTNADDADQASMLEEHLGIAMQVVHHRALEGFCAWCLYAANSNSLCSKKLDPEELRAYARNVEDNSNRPSSRLFAEALMLRVMESVGEQMLQCPERLSYLLFHIFHDAGGLEDTGETTFSFDMDELHDGLLQMNIHTNPYMRQKMPNGKWELGLNFDDINESGIQCREHVTKTFKEPASMMVIIDFLLSYRVAIMLKVYCLVVSGYLYLGSGQGDDESTTHNGTLWAPKWLRINYIQYTAIADAAIWSYLEFLLLVYTLWQRWPSLGYRSPGIPGVRWFLWHACNLSLSSMGGLWVYSSRSFERKPWVCAHSDATGCEDPRSERLFSVLQAALVYWAVRALVFCVMHGKQSPIFIYGTPTTKVRVESGRGRLATLSRDFRADLAWLVMLGLCIGIEVVWLLPTVKGLDWNTACGWDLLGEVGGLPNQQGVCSEEDQSKSFGCISCISSVIVAWSLVLLGSFVDIYFVFYIASAVVGSVMGQKRELNDLKNTSLPVDLREGRGREAKLFENIFGPGWQHIWRVMVKSLYEESLISHKQATSLAQAAGIPLECEAPLTHREKKQKPIHLTRFPTLAAERLAFFFQSLKWLDKNGSGREGGHFDPVTDALTGADFNAASIPSLTQIIPAYNEAVIPAVEFLRSGGEAEDARNSSPDDQPGLGDLTVPPVGDGVNSNLAFMISQFPDEWVFLAKRLHDIGLTQSAESQDLYQDFMKNRLNQDTIFEVRFWAAMRMQSVAKTVVGALQYGRALASLPKFRQHYANHPEKRVPEDHAEVILAHQTYGHPEGIERNDDAVRALLKAYSQDPLYLVFDLKKGSKAELWKMVEDFLTARGGYGAGTFEQASVKCRWDNARNGLRVLEVLPRKFPLRLGQGEYKTQGKACNQLNGLRFASGHYVQALDCNMGTFIGEAFKVPYVLRMFMPLDKEDRSAPRCRYLGFREYIYTGREGTVGKCHAAAEWTFGTINQRFLSGMGMRMHYGHPDFLDGFWARNRGGMSKSSPVVNLSEDIFAGYNVRMREEGSPHIDALEFEKGREATFNAASNFFSKISGGSISVIRSRDNHLLCERIGLLHSLSFYFTSVAFYISNLLVDVTIYLYVILFVLFNLAGLGPGELSALGSTFCSEWLISMGLVTLIPQLCEMVLEYGAMHAVKHVIGGIPAATFFFIFQNKNIASSMKEGVVTGIARYFFTGRPAANQHQTWRDIYATYWKSHYMPAMSLMAAYLVYIALAIQNGQGKLPMALVVTSFIAWIVTPIVFSPLPRWNLIVQDLREFNGFITGGAGKDEADIPEVVARGKAGTVRSLYECGLANDLSSWTERHFAVLLLGFCVRALMGVYILAVLPAEVLDYLPVFFFVLSVSWVIILGYFAAGLNNVFLVLSFCVWGAAWPMAHNIVGDRFSNPDVATRLPEYLISAVVFFYGLALAKEFVIVSCRLGMALFPCADHARSERRLHECIRLCFDYFLTHQLQTLQAYFVLFANLATAAVLAAIDRLFCNVHTWFLLNRELARTPAGERYMENTTPNLNRLPGWDLSDSDSDSEDSGPPSFVGQGPGAVERQWP